MDKPWMRVVHVLVIFLIGYFVAIYEPAPGQALKTKLGI